MTVRAEHTNELREKRAEVLRHNCAGGRQVTSRQDEDDRCTAGGPTATDITANSRHVRFAPDSGHVSALSMSALCHERTLLRQRRGQSLCEARLTETGVAAATNLNERLTKDADLKISNQA
jgi:hypothetical protein